MTIVARIDAIFSQPDMSRDLAEALSVVRGRSADEEFDAMVARVEGRFESSRNYSVVLQFIQDHSKLRDADVIRLLEFIYSSMVNKFKGELGEVLARPSIAAFRELLGSRVELFLGADIRSRQLNRPRGWYPAADALYCIRHGQELEVVALAEVKSKTTSLAELREQVEKHIVRMRGGLWVRGEVIPAQSIRIRTGDGRSFAIEEINEDVARVVPSLVVGPFRGAASHVPVRHAEHPQVWVAELPWRQDDISEAAYRLMSWYFARIGPKVFRYRAEAPTAADRRRPAAHDDLSLEENGRHAFMEAIYHTTGRQGFDPREVPPRGHRTAWQTLLWLYNSLGFGYEAATAEEFMFPPFEPSPASDDRVTRRNRAVDAYRAGRYAEALATLPSPAEQADPWWSRREWLMLARVHARNNDDASARSAFERATSLPPIESLSLPIEVGGVDVLIALAGGNEVAVGDRLSVAMDTLARVREEVRKHEANGWELPSDIEPNSAREGVIDLAVAHAALGNCVEAVALLERLRQLRGWELEFFANDPLLARCTGAPTVLAHLREVTGRRGEFAIF